MLPQEGTQSALCEALIGCSLTGAGDVRYFLRELIGQGGQGWVFKANYDEPDGMWVVVKVLRPDSIHHEALVRFRREAEVLRIIGSQATPSPNVVRFFDHGMASIDASGVRYDLPFTVLEYVDGITLADVLDGPPQRALPIVRARKVIRQVVRALETVHAHRMVHRDLKPSNILLMNQAGHEVAKVTDFGLVKLVDLQLTQTAAIAGATLGYAPPEQYEHGNERVSERTDVFSLAAILFETLAGRAAFPYQDGENPLRVITRILAGPRPSLTYDPSVISPELFGQTDLIARIDAEVGRALQADPAKRHATCREFWSAVEPLLRVAERRAIESGLIAGPTDASVSGVNISALADGRSRPPLAGTNETTLDGPGSMVPSNRKVAVRVSQPCTAKLLSPPVPGVALRAALIGVDGSMLAVGPSGVYRWADRAWSVLPTPAGVDTRMVRGVLRSPDGQLLLFGDRGFVATLSPTGDLALWPWRQHDINLFDGWMDGPGDAVFVGDRSSSGGGIIAIASHAPPYLQIIDTAVRLRSVARTAGGALIACGDAGTLLHLELPAVTPIPWERSGHLHCIRPRPAGGAAIVGSGGHALYLSPSLDVLLEPVQTTRDLLAVAPDTQGIMWASGADGRLLRYDGTTWERISPELAVPSNLVALGAALDGVLALGDNGVVVGAGRGGT